MTIYDKAREIGELIRASEQGQQRAVAMESFLMDTEAVEIMEKYESYQRNIEASMQKGTMTQEQFMSATTELKRLGAEVKSHPVAGVYIETVNDFNKLLKQVFQIIQSTALGQMEDACGAGCKSGCSCGCEHSS